MLVHIVTHHIVKSNGMHEDRKLIQYAYFLSGDTLCFHHLVVVYAS